MMLMTTPVRSIQVVRKNLELAVNWLSKSAKQGFAKAQNRLGIYYRDGIGVKANPVDAYAWFSAAIANGLEEAKKARDELASTLSAEQKIQAIDLSNMFITEYPNKEK
jgi:enhanced entry protein LpnE